MSTFDDWPSATSSFDEPNRRFDPAAPEFRSFAVNPTNAYDLTTGLGRHLMDSSPATGEGLTIEGSELSCRQFGAMIVFGLIGAVLLGLIF